MIEFYKNESELNLLATERKCAKARDGELLILKYCVDAEVKKRGIE